MVCVMSLMQERQGLTGPPTVGAAVGRRGEGGNPLLTRPWDLVWKSQGLLGPATWPFLLPPFSVSRFWASFSSGSSPGCSLHRPLWPLLCIWVFHAFCRTKISINNFSRVAWTLPSAAALEELSSPYLPSQPPYSLMLSSCNSFSQPHSRTSLLFDGHRLPYQASPSSLLPAPWGPKHCSTWMQWGPEGDCATPGGRSPVCHKF